jgi:thiamine biosynthesis lipoprotein
VRAAPPGEIKRPLILEARAGGLTAVRFEAMASPCELVCEETNQARVIALADIAAREAWRIEHKYSRYRDDSVVAWMHSNRGREVALDTETSQLMDFAHSCFVLSDGLFDITSGPLRQAWHFDGSDRLPAPDQVEALLPRIGFSKLHWENPRLAMPEGMELDFGGIGKEYAVDRAFQLVAARSSSAFLINFGGDLRASGPHAQGRWQVGVERPGSDQQAAMILALERGALATSGDARRFLLKDGVRYGHVLNPKTGWPVVDAPRSVSVAASSTVEAGMFATMALLKGADARSFLDAQSVRYWIID